MLRETMYVMFKDNHFPHLDMKDFLIMWQSLAYKWNIRIGNDQWFLFSEEINCIASNRQDFFNETFDKYFI